MKRVVVKALLFLLSIAGIASCASQAAPTGGRLDSIPPRILFTEPAQRSLNQHPAYMALEFSKFVGQRTEVQKNIFLTPPVKTEYSWAGTTLFVTFKEALDSNTTVALTLGTQYTDWDGNKPEAAYTLIFSTGNKLDSGTVRATVYGEKTEGVTGFLYQLNGMNADTLNPATTKPKYKSQTGTKGTMDFPALAAGTYRLFAVRDAFRNDVIDAGTDAFGTTTNDILIPEGATVDATVRLTSVFDIQAPRLFDVRQVSLTHLIAKFSERLNPASVRAGNFTLRDSVSSEPLEQRITSVHPDPANAAIVHLYLPSPFSLPDKRIQLTANVQDSSGNSILDSARTAVFSVGRPDEIQPDTLSPKLLRTVLANDWLPRTPALQPLITDSVRGMPQKPRIAFVFSAALAAEIPTTATTSAIVWENAAQQTILFNLTAPYANMLVVEPRAPLAPNSWFTLGLRLASLRAWHGAALADSVVLLRFQTNDPRDYGGITGTLLDSGLVRTSLTRDSLVKATTGSVRVNATRSGQYVIVLEVQDSQSQEASGQSFAQGQSPVKQTLPNGLPNTQGRPSGIVPPQNINPVPQSSPFAKRRFEKILRQSSNPRAALLWEFTDVPAAAYTLTAFYDANGNGRYDYGTAFPYAPAERFVILPTPLQVRQRWIVENTTIILP
jgi:Bacterial Ig-like domain